MRICEVAKAAGVPWSTVRNAFNAEPEDVTARIDALVSRRMGRALAIANGVKVGTYYKRRARGMGDLRAARKWAS
jgi:hypothetical protein